MENYKIIKYLNKGSYGKIYLVERNVCKTKYALKSLVISNIDRYTSLSIQNEIKILLTNTSDYLLKCYDLFIDKNRLCIITDFIDNGDLDNYLKKKKDILEHDEIIKIFLKICVGINSLHYNNIVHRDIKPANILISENGEIKICDFGISKYLNYSKLTKTLIGTPYFISPEQYKNLYYDYKVDTWALGCVLYQLINKTVPFEGKNMQELKNNIINKELTELEIDNKYLQNLLRELLQKNRHTRLNIEQFLDTIESKKILNYLNIDYEKNKFKSYSFKSIPYSIDTWESLLKTLKKDFNLPKSIKIPIQLPKIMPIARPLIEETIFQKEKKGAKATTIKPIVAKPIAAKPIVAKPIAAKAIAAKAIAAKAIEEDMKKKIENNKSNWAEMYRLGKPLPKIESKVKQLWAKNTNLCKDKIKKKYIVKDNSNMAREVDRDINLLKNFYKNNDIRWIGNLRKY